MNNEERRFQAAVAAMQGLCANSSATIPAKSYAEAAVSFADALLAELDRTKPEPEANICEKCGNPTMHMGAPICYGCAQKQPDADGWIPHSPGDPMPCDEDCVINVLHHDGEISFEEIAGFWAKTPGNLCAWSDPECDERIVAWKPA